jgi:hypothetical protein
MDWAEDNGYDWDVWNVEATLLNANVDWEIGLSATNWQIYFHEMNLSPHNHTL